MISLRDDLQKIVKGEVADNAETIRVYSRDASLFRVAPQAVVFPKDAEDVTALVKYATDHEGVTLTPRSAGTDMTGGSLGESIVMDFTRHMNRVLEVGEGKAVAEPGVFYRDFERETLKRGYILPSYPASREICALGGMVANNSGGEKTLFYGKTDRYVERLEAVLADGEIYKFSALDKAALDKKMNSRGFEGEIYRRVYKLLEENYDAIQAAKPNVSKNSAGYALWDVWNKRTFDLTKLFVGSQGTLGIIVKIGVNLVKPQKHSKLLAIFLKDLMPLPAIVHDVLSFKPESFEAFDDNTLKFAIRYIRELTGLIKPRNMFSLAWHFLPEFWAFLTGGLPKLVLLAEFAADDEREIDERARAAEAAVRRYGVKTRFARTEEESRKYWTIRRESFNLLRYHLKDKRTAPFIDDVVVASEKLPQFLPALQKILDKYDLLYTVAGHVGDGNFHIIPLMDMTKERNRVIIPALSEEVYKLVFKYGGSTTGEHNDGLVRTPYLREMYGEKIYKLFEEIKKIFDPRGILNPGKKVGGSIKYALAHLAEENK
jgi:FAD/FMN-containing dehydrogenase